MIDETECWNAGYDSVMSGPNTENCHFKFFGARWMTRAWEKGVKAAQKELTDSEDSQHPEYAE